jgi:hypothetical protein
MESAAVQTPKGIAYTGRFTPLGVSRRSVTDILATAAGTDTGEDGLTPAQRFIIRYITEHGDENGEVASRDVIDAGDRAGYTESDLTKARFKARNKIATRQGRQGTGLAVVNHGRTAYPRRRNGNAAGWRYGPHSRTNPPGQIRASEGGDQIPTTHRRRPLRRVRMAYSHPRP